jgi:putative heme-binding domain-containing protein
MYPEVVKLFAGNKPATGWNKQMAALAWRLHPPEAAHDLALRAQAATLSPGEREAALTALSFINNRAAADNMLALSKSRLQDMSQQAAYWLSFRQSNDWYNLLDWSKLNINTAYERTVARMKVKKQIILDERQSTNERRSRAQEMASDSMGGQLLIGMAAEKQLPEILFPFIQQMIFKNPDPTVRVQAGNYFKNPESDKLYSIPEIRKLPPDITKGKAVFTTRCSSCHKVGTEGNAIGPELTAIAKKFDDSELLEAIINPSAAIVFGYEPWLVNTKDGESLYGFLVSDNKQTMVLKDIAGRKHVIQVSKISSKQKQDKSLMPDPANNGLTQQDLANVVAYLRNGVNSRRQQ